MLGLASGNDRAVLSVSEFEKHLFKVLQASRLTSAFCEFVAICGLITFLLPRVERGET
jgi:hypothetical protein